MPNGSGFGCFPGGNYWKHSVWRSCVVLCIEWFLVWDFYNVICDCLESKRMFICNIESPALGAEEGT